VFCLVDSIIHPLNNWGQGYTRTVPVIIKSQYALEVFQIRNLIILILISLGSPHGFSIFMHIAYMSLFTNCIAAVTQTTIYNRSLSCMFVVVVSLNLVHSLPRFDEQARNLHHSSILTVAEKDLTFPKSPTKHTTQKVNINIINLCVVQYLKPYKTDK